MAKNISKVYLLNVPLEDDMRNTLYFTSVANQHSYFVDNIGKTYNNVSYQSETRTFRCPDQLDTVRQYNYIMYQNSAYSNKWFYGFIKKMEYVSDGYTDVIFEVDPLQTYMFDITVNPSFVEREHTNDDTIGANTYPEGLEKGQFVNNYANVLEMDASPEGDYNLVVFQVTELLDNTTFANLYNQYQYCGLFSGIYMFGVRVQYARDVVKAYVAKGKDAAIVAIFYASGAFFDNRVAATIYTGPNSTLPVDIYYSPIKNTQYSILLKNSTTIPINTTLDGYSPRNNKLFTREFNYLYFTNNAGTDVIYSYELFASNTPKFFISGVPCQGCSIKLVPQDYKGNAENYAEGMMGGKLPLCAWATDYYTNWVTQNAVNISAGLISGVASSLIGGAASVATGSAVGVVGAGVNMFSTIASTMGEIDKASKIPDQAHGNTNAGDLNFAARRYFFHYQKMSIRAEYAAKIDDYLDMFGYKTCRVKVPNVAHRQNWWYTKTVSANITGNVPNDEMNKIKEAYNNGLTFWRNPANFLNYSVSNGVV